MFARVSSRSHRHSPGRRAARVLNEHPLWVANEELRILMSAIQDLIDRLNATADPELKRLRRQAEAALGRARAAIGDDGALADQARQLAVDGQAYVQRRPLTSLGTVALAMLAIGLATRRATTTD